MWMRAIVFHVARLLLAVCAVWALIRWQGELLGMGVFAGAMLAIGIGSAALLRLQPTGKVTAINHLAAFFIPWGYWIGKGRSLVPIVMLSWAVWTLISLGELVALRYVWSANREIVAVLLFLSWVVDGGLILRLMRTVATQTNRQVVKPLVAILALLALLMAASAGLVIGYGGGMAGIALSVVGLPLAVVMGGYGIFMLFMLTVGRKARWN